MAHTFTSTTCPLCFTYFDRVPVDGDGIDTYAVLEVRPCSACGALLCACCEQFACDGCGETFCAEHLVTVPDGNSPLHCCKACADECEPYELPAAIPPQSETRPALHVVEVA